MRRLSVGVCVLLLVAVLWPSDRASAVYSSDITSAADYIEYSHYSSNTGDRAFDNTANAWCSLEAGAAVNAVSWIGQDFGSPREVRRVTLYQNGIAWNSVSSLAIEYSEDAATWLQADVVGVATSYQAQSFNLDAVGTYQYWRLIGLSATTGGVWCLTEVEMMEWSSDDTPTPSNIIVATIPASGNQYQIDRSASWGDGVIVLFIGVLCIVVMIGVAVQVNYGRSQR